MTLREFIGSGLPPAPETPALRRFRLTTAAGCFLAALLVCATRAAGNRPLWFATLASLVATVALAALLVLIVRKVRHDLRHWTPERVALHHFAVSIEHPDRPLGKP
jgi:O-antigen/teichoic acid export membrane protein